MEQHVKLIALVDINVFVEMDSKDDIVKNECKEGTQILVKIIHVIMEGPAWLLVIHSSVIAHLVTKDHVVMRKLGMLNQQFVIQTHVLMGVHVKRMEKGTIVFVMFNTLVHNAKLTNVRNVTLTQGVSTDTVNAGQDGMEMVTNVSKRKDVANRAVCMPHVIRMFVNATVVTKETDTRVLQ